MAGLEPAIQLSIKRHEVGWAGVGSDSVPTPAHGEDFLDVAQKEKGCLAAAFPERPLKAVLSDLLRLFAAVRIAQHIAAAPDGLDIVGAIGGGGQLLAQLADKDVDDL